MFWRVSAVILVTGALFGPSLSAQDKEDAKDLARTAFVLKGPDGREWLFIRLTALQHVVLKAKTLAPKDQQAGRLVLTSRQRLAVKNALALGKPLPKVDLRASGKALQYSKGLGGYYVARLKGPFLGFLGNLDKDVEEPQEPPEAPPANLVDTFKP